METILVDNLYYYATDLPHYIYLSNNVSVDATSLVEKPWYLTKTIAQKIQPFTVNIYNSKIIAITLLGGKNKMFPMLYQLTSEGNLTELTPRPKYCSSIWSVDVLWIPSLSWNNDPKDMIISILDTLTALNFKTRQEMYPDGVTEEIFDAILQIRPLIKMKSVLSYVKTPASIMLHDQDIKKECSKESRSEPIVASLFN
jgi:hypothetical protein